MPSPDVAGRPRPANTEIIFLFIGGAHHVYHLAPVAAELTRLLPGHSVTCLSCSAETSAALERVRAVLEVPALRIEPVRVPLWGRLLSAVTGRHSSTKMPLLLSLSPRLRRAAAIVTPERTSAQLRMMGLRHKLMIHFRHGAGDRAPRSEQRQSAFDLVVVPGEKDLRRAQEKGYMPAAKMRACGYVKLEFCTRLARNAPPLFENGRPTVLYNPHFDAATSSWPLARQVIECFAAQSRYNLIFAPHIRAAENMEAAERAEWEALARPGSIIVDLGSERLIDMSYVLAADIYLGDISSQLYEFLARPRPVAFLNAHRVAWKGDPRFAGWELGEVAESVEEIMPMLDRAVHSHPGVVQRQQAALRQAFGDIEGAARRGAEVIAAAVAARA
ncbi:hypothetical protein [Roseomonas marmotae]|uniref:Glycosyl transferase n=1 Tax=Roseomonas marmotae TaxID=2768161 RepID=A0ABS3KA55_9PROT|nr:hypothetical protein [Roseomonas marmotae]MBO1074354.1 hypothetical protein [Roseomonas marmotae]QTI78103.1 hypothetical protein IAI58_10240 [Roseomonas marmotae]